MESAAMMGHIAEQFKKREIDPLCQRLRQILVEQMVILYGQGIIRFCCSPAPGVGFWAAEAVFQLKGNLRDSDITLVCFLRNPFCQ